MAAKLKHIPPGPLVDLAPHQTGELEVVAGPVPQVQVNPLPGLKFKLHQLILEADGLGGVGWTLGQG